MSEMWAPVPGACRYEASSEGRVRKADTHVLLASSRRNKSANSYLCVWIILDDGTKKRAFVHHLVLESFVGPRPSNQEALHADDVKSNNSLSNLRWGTRKENVADRLRNGNDQNLRKTHCPRNHPLSGDNLIPSQLALGRRSCRCARDISRAHRARQKAAV